MSRVRFVLTLCIALVLAGAVSGWVYLLAAEPANWQLVPTVPDSVVTPPSSYAVAADYASASAAAAVKPRAATKSFKSALSAAAAAAHKDGTITRWQLARIRMAIAFRADAMAEAQACCWEQAQNDGLMRAGSDADLDGFDWAQLLAFLKEFLPMILQIISILG